MKYSIIYADPPWKYNNPKSCLPKLGGITYSVMSHEEISLLSVQDIAAKDCALFLWATMPKLKEALYVIDAWGFKYITCAFTWIKLNPSGRGIYSGLGHWTNGNAELCLFAKIGSPKRINKNVKQVQFYARGKHSEKPAEIRNEIINLMGDLPRIELFARQHTPNWHAWGNEIESDIVLKFKEGNNEND